MSQLLIPPSNASSTPQGQRIARCASALAVTLALAALTGCASWGHSASHAVMRDAQSLGLRPGGIAQTDAVDIDSRWWRAFGDSQLDALIDRALQGNPNLQVARARVASAQATVSGARAADLPQIGLDFEPTRTKFSNSFIYPPPLGGGSYQSALLQFNTSWELDFFGKNGSAIKAAIGAANAAQAEADAARILLATRVARTYIQWAHLNGVREVARRMLAQRADMLKLVRKRLQAGLGTTLELRQSEGGLPEMRQQIEALSDQIEQTQHALDALVGQPGITATLKMPELQDFKEIGLQASIPANLLGRRADIAAARWRIEAATQNVTHAKTLFYPNINLVAIGGLQSLGFAHLLKSASQEWGIGPAITLPIFEGGKLRANLRGKKADLDAAIESYNAAVLDAVRDVADQVSAVQSVARQQDQQREGQRAAESAYQIARERYQAGLGTYLNVLAAETGVLAQRRQAADLAARALDAQAALANALGGGYRDAAAAPSPRDKTEATGLNGKKAPADPTTAASPIEPAGKASKANKSNTASAIAAQR
ncbi:MAG: efflux transporter outer membrane subunit [Burkholderiaceae bacterium]|nr:efflux transporter outer membrane subunit [Burkholderiaceae bacterium]